MIGMLRVLVVDTSIRVRRVETYARFPVRGLYFRGSDLPTLLREK